MYVATNPWVRVATNPVLKYRDGHFTVICAKTAEPIEMPYGLWDWMSPRNHVGSTQVLRDVAMTTNFGTKIDITGLV